ncbi:NnrU family protein [Azospirillum halopraeferens]|uniref:NnrU family protein n=1 Tax=Azospirillum halopraeferens TaxID=34010 RepID=UPI00040C2525|nr:NnrU family protein [Azospirillum halopraeferens]
MSTTLYLLSAAALFAGHAVPSWPGVRPALIARMGRTGFITLHSLLSLVTLALFVHAYRTAEVYGHVFFPADGAAMAAVVLMPVAVFLVVARLMRPSGEPQTPRPPAGIYRITRHPGSMGLLLWALLHLQATGDLRRVILFATMAAIALFAIVKNDWVLRHAGTPEAGTFRTRTSVIPFAAILSGRQRPVVSEIGVTPFLAALTAYAALLLAHPRVFGVDPLYWLP